MPPTRTRPTSDRVREALFNVLAARLDFAGIHVLDLYAGSGALGLEALSRGAEHVTFVEADPRATAVIRQNLAMLGLNWATVLKGRVSAFLDLRAQRAADLVLADPPYDMPAGEVEAMLAALTASGWTAAGTVAVVERRASSPPLNWPAGWSVWQARRYGDTRLEIAEHD